MVAQRGSRSSQTRSLLGPELYKKVREAKLLVVGAGGIGCELLKNLVLVGFGNIEIIDLDTIDLSNLNRQFLFRKSDIKKSKSLVAAAFATHFNPLPSTSSSSSSQPHASSSSSASNGNGNGNGNSKDFGMNGEWDEGKGVKIHARHGNIKDRENDVAWMGGFDLVLSALDNLDARRHVNKLCCAAGVPLIESGTQGYLGQVTPMQKDRTNCFDCVEKPTPKTFPVCTIRATPSEPIHCIVWGKSYLLGKLFGEDDEAGDETELEKAKADGENAEEIDNLKKEAAAFREVRNALGEEDGPARVFSKVFSEDINRLLQMEDMWKVPGRVKPKPLVYEEIMNGTFVAPPVIVKAQANGKKKEANGQAAAAAAPSEEMNGNGNAAVLKDQRELSVKDNLDLFIDSCKRLAARAIAHPDIEITFDKDDDDTLDFVLATANLRATAYGIPTKTRFQVKEMAGNIIPAIATTNAIIAGFIVMRALNILADDWKQCRNVFLKGDPVRPLGNFATQAPEPGCGVCRDTYIPLKCDPTKLTLGTFIGEVVRGWLGWKENEDGDDMGIEVYQEKRLLADPDFDDNYAKTLADLGIDRGKMITVTDEDGVYMNVQFAVCDLDEPNAETPFELSGAAPTVPHRPPPPAPPREPTPPPQIAGKKRSAPDDAEQQGSGKRIRQEGVVGEDGVVDMIVDSDEEFEIL